LQRRNQCYQLHVVATVESQVLYLATVNNARHFADVVLTVSPAAVETFDSF
jgi:hypothetical protein